MKNTTKAFLLSLLVASYTQVKPFPSMPSLFGSTGTTGLTGATGSPEITPLTGNLGLLQVTPPTMTGTAGNGLPIIESPTISLSPTTLPALPVQIPFAGLSVTLNPISTDSIQVPATQELFDQAVPTFKIDITEMPSVEGISQEQITPPSITSPATILSTHDPIGYIAELEATGPAISGPVYTISGPDFAPVAPILDLPEELATIHLSNPVQDVEQSI